MPDYQPVRTEQAARRSQEAAAAGPVAEPHPLLSLQARAGNQAVARMVQRAAEEEELQARHDPSIQRAAEEEELQAKHDLSVQRAAEEDELQAKHDPSVQRAAEEDELQAKHDPAIQRSEGAEAEEEELQARHDPSLQRAAEEDELQAKHDPAPQVGLEGGPVGDSIESTINSARGGGSAAPSGIVGQVEAATGADLSGVRVHQDQQSDTLSRQLTAKAFTTGSDIFLRNDVSTSDNHLMAHELAHVVQQSSGRTAAAGGGMTAGPANDPLEHEADQLASAVLSGNAQRETEEARA